MQHTTIRTATKKDLIALSAIYNNAIINTTAVYSYLEYTIQQIEEWYDFKVDNGLPIRIAIIGNEVIGFASLSTFRPRPGYINTVENSVFVNDDFQRQGIGHLLLEDIIQQAKILEKHCIVAAIDSDNLSSIKLHKKLGFKTVGTFKEIGYKFDRWLDLNFMQLLLSPSI